MPEVKTEVGGFTSSSAMTAQTRIDSPVETESSASTTPWAGLFEPSRTGAAERRRARVRKMTKALGGGGPEGEEGAASPGWVSGKEMDTDGDVKEDEVEGGEGTNTLSKKQQRMIRNRESAALSRKRKRDQVEALELEVQQLKEKNRQLKQRLSRYENLDSLESVRGASSYPPQTMPQPGLSASPRGPLQPWFNTSTHPSGQPGQGPPAMAQQLGDTLPLPTPPPPTSYNPLNPCYPAPPQVYSPPSYLSMQDGSTSSDGGGSSGLSSTGMSSGTSQMPPPPSLIGGMPLGGQGGYPLPSDDLLDVLPLIDSTSNFYYGDAVSSNKPPAPATSTTPTGAAVISTGTAGMSFAHVDSRDWDIPPVFSEQNSLQAVPLSSFAGASSSMGGAGGSLGALGAGGSLGPMGAGGSLGGGSLAGSATASCDLERQLSWSSQQGMGGPPSTATSSSASSGNNNPGLAIGTGATGGGPGSDGSGSTSIGPSSAASRGAWSYSGGMKRNNPW